MLNSKLKLYFRELSEFFKISKFLQNHAIQFFAPRGVCSCLTFRGRVIPQKIANDLISSEQVLTFTLTPIYRTYFENLEFGVTYENPRIMKNII